MSRYWYPLSRPSLGEEEIEAVTETLRSGQTTMGATVEAFEAAFARYVGVPHAVMVNSGSSADLLVAMASPIGHTTVVPAVTWPTHAWSFHIDGRVAFCDVDGFNTTAELIERRLGDENIDSIGVVHLMGVPCDMDEIVSLACAYGLEVVEDCCEALGARYKDKPVGSFGLAAAWSFFFSHQMTTMEGGMVTTADPEIADSVRSLRSHGWERHKGGDPYTFVMKGFNLRPTEVSAAIGLVQLEKLDAMNKLRSENRRAFCEVLTGHPVVSFPDVPKGAEPSWFGLPMLIHERRDELAAHLEAGGVETRPILGGNLLRQPAFEHFYGVCPGADYVDDHGLFVGLHPEVDSGAEQVAQVIGEFLS